MTIAKLIVANLGPADEGQVVRFIGRDNVSVEQEWTNKKNALNFAIDNLFVGGGQSAVIDALYLAGDNIRKRQKLAPNKRYAIVLISDVEERNSFYDQKQLLQQLLGTDIQIFPIALIKDLSDDAGSNGRSPKSSVKKIAKTIAASTGGTSFILDERSKEADYRNTLKSLIYELRSQIVIGYTLGDVTKGDRNRKLTVTIADGPNGDKRKSIIKENIILPSE